MGVPCAGCRADVEINITSIPVTVGGKRPVRSERALARCPFGYNTDRFSRSILAPGQLIAIEAEGERRRVSIVHLVFVKDVEADSARNCLRGSPRSARSRIRRSGADEARPSLLSP